MKSPVCYIPMLEGQSDEVGRWLDEAGPRFGIIPVMLPLVDWNDDLTPWPASPIFKKGKAFAGRADSCLKQLENQIIPSLEAEMDEAPGERWLLGVSLSGLFAVWAAAKSPLFSRIASISGSFWYPGFTEWLKVQDFHAESVYISLGDKEAEGKNPHLKEIAADTASVVETLRDKGIPTFFEWTEGSHFGPVIPRMDKALKALSKH